MSASRPQEAPAQTPSARTQALERANALVEQLMASTRVAFFQTSPDGRITHWNQGAEAIYGHTAAQALGQASSLLMPPERRAEWRSLESKVSSGEALEHVETMHLARGGRRIHVTGAVLPIQTGAAWILWDQTDRFVTQREHTALLAASNAASMRGPLRSVVDAVARTLHGALQPRATLVHLFEGDDGRALRLAAGVGASPAAMGRLDSVAARESSTNAWAQTVRQRRWRVVRSPGELDAEFEPEPGAARAGALVVPIVLDEATYGTLTVVAPGLHDPRDHQVATLGVVAHYLALAIHERRLVSRLRSSVEELREANKELDGFAYAASHDLSEPLRTITSFSRLLREEHFQEMPAEAREYLERIHAGAQRLRAMLTGLLEHARVARTTEVPGPVDAMDVLREVREALAAALEDADARLEIEGELPWVLAPRVHLVEVFSNLVANGIKFNDSRNPWVGVSARRVDKETVEFLVDDNGIGIPVEARERVFGLFARLHAPDKYPGTGAGLAIVAKCVANWGGRIVAEDSPAGGTRFRFTVRESEKPGRKVEESPADVLRTLKDEP